MDISAMLISRLPTDPPDPPLGVVDMVWKPMRRGPNCMPIATLIH